MIFKTKMACLSMLAIAFIYGCSNDSSSTANEPDNSSNQQSTESWLTNPAETGPQVYSIQLGNSVKGFECQVYEGDSALVLIASFVSMGIETSVTSKIELVKDCVLVTSYIESDPATKEIMDALCTSQKESYPDAECTDSYVKTFQNSGQYTATFNDAMDNLKQQSIDKCKDEEYKFKADSSDDDDDIFGENSSSCVPDTLFRADGSFTLDIPDNCI